MLIVNVPGVVLASADPECQPGTFVGACSFSGGAILGGVYVYDSITIPAGVTITASLPLTLHARDNLAVHGSIADTPGITLVSDLMATITGTIRAADGNSLAPQGADVQVQATSLNIDGGTIQSGNGAPGLDMVQDVGDSMSAVTSVGTAGAKGGDIVVNGASASLNGHFVLGNGGRGGHASALGGTLAATAVGGNGGPSGNLVLPVGYDAITIHNVGRLTGGQGGEGGEATAVTLPELPPLYGVAGQGVTDDKANLRACNGAARSSPFGATGNSGCAGASANANAGNGGDGIVGGGKGGKAVAKAGQGGMGGRGADGSLSWCWFFSVSQPSCPAYYGGQGGSGGSGGPAVANGGRGGNGLLFGGVGGDAFATGGRGGNGGNGANAGGGYIIGWTGTVSDAVWTAIGCVAQIAGSGGSTWSVVACTATVASGFTFSFTCGHPGRAGVGGGSGSASAIGGTGGYGLAGFALQADSGWGSNSYTGSGTSGSQGGKQPVNVIMSGQVVNLCP